MNYKNIKTFSQYAIAVVALFSVLSLTACGQRAPLSKPADKVEDTLSY